MRLNLVPLLGVWLLIGLAGCASPANTYYTLTPIEPAALVGNALTKGAPTLAIVEINTPASLDRPQIVMQHDGNRVDVHEFDRWISPLDGMIRATLVNDLNARLGPARLLDTPDAADYGLSLTIEAFGQTDGSVVLRGRWTIKTQHTDNGQMPPQAFSESSPVDPKDVSASVSAMSHLLSTVSDAIAASVDRLAAKHP